VTTSRGRRWADRIPEKPEDAAAAVAADASTRPTEPQCRDGCTSYFTVHYLAMDGGTPEDMRARLEQNLDLCVEKCLVSASVRRARCWSEATTAEAAEACAD